MRESEYLLDRPDPTEENMTDFEAIQALARKFIAESEQAESLKLSIERTRRELLDWLSGPDSKHAGSLDFSPAKECLVVGDYALTMEWHEEGGFQLRYFRLVGPA